MSHIVPFESSSNVPAYLRAAEGNLADLGTASGGFDVISIKGKVFTRKSGDEKTLIVNPETGDPAASLEVVILGVGPSGNNYAKVWYAKTFEEGSDAKPDCYSNDGIAPAADSTNPQANKCAVCPRNQWGAKITDSGKKSKECQDSKRLAIAPASQPNDAFLLRVPAASLKALKDYGAFAAKRGARETFAIVTKVGFDYTVAHPQLTFKTLGWVDEKTYREAAVMAKSDVVQTIIGALEMPKFEDDTLGEKPAFIQDAPVEEAPTKAAAEAPVEAPKAKRSTAKPVDDSILDSKPVASTKVEGDDPAKKADPIESMSSSLAAAVSDLDLDFDD